MTTAKGHQQLYCSHPGKSGSGSTCLSSSLRCMCFSWYRLILKYGLNMCCPFIKVRAKGGCVDPAMHFWLPTAIAG
uniref:Uncharacterized protein n=1 Tax=Laticauda laticaudata TaxID=8630 RepID=A0A8C5RGU7_LATLA